MSTDTVDILIKNAFVVTVNARMDLLPGAGIAIKDGRIVEVGAAALRRRAARIMDAGGGICMPGLINSHTHAAMALFRGYADDLPLNEWLGRVIFPLEAEYVTPEFVRTGISLAAAEMIMSGTTAFHDMYYFTAEAAETVSAIGVRGMLGEALLDYPTPNMKTAADGLRYTRDIIRAYRDSDYVIPCVDPHAIYTCSTELLESAAALSREYSAPLHIHANETRDEIETCVRRNGARPIVCLERIGFLGPLLTVAHCVHPDGAETEALRANRVSVAHCLESNLKLASGIAPVHALAARGVNVCLGTDGPASNNNLNMFEEMSACAKHHKAAADDPTAMDARTVIRMATLNGARAIGRENDLGSIEPGKLADLIILDCDKPHLTPLFDVHSQLVYSAQAADVDTVIVNGRVVMENRELKTMDIDAVLSGARAFAKRLRHA